MYSQINKNKVRTGILMILFIALFVMVFFAVSNIVDKEYASTVIVFGSIFAIVSTFVAYYSSDKIVLRIANAHPADPFADKYIVDVVEGLASANRLPLPKVYMIETDVPNAFATGRNPGKAVIAVTRGLVNTLNREELEGVLAHEMSHILNYDILYASIVAVLAGSVVMIAYSMRWFAFGGSRRSRRSSGSSDGNAIIVLISILFIILSPIFAKLVQMAISRKREYLADAQAARMIGYPLGLASALEKLRDLNDPKADKRIKGLDNEAIAGLFIVNPLKSSEKQNLFSTHPPLNKRIEILRKM